MGLISTVLGAPFAPVRLAFGIAERLRQQADQQFHDPVAIRAELEEVARKRADGTISEEAASAWEDDLVARAMARSTHLSGE